MYFSEENTSPDLEKEIREAEASDRFGKPVEEVSDKEFQGMVENLIPEDHSELGFVLAKLIENYHDLTGDRIGVLGVLVHLQYQFSTEMEEQGGPVESGAVVDSSI